MKDKIHSYKEVLEALSDQNLKNGIPTEMEITEETFLKLINLQTFQSSKGGCMVKRTKELHRP